MGANCRVIRFDTIFLNLPFFPQWFFIGRLRPSPGSSTLIPPRPGFQASMFVGLNNVGVSYYYYMPSPMPSINISILPRLCIINQVTFYAMWRSFLPISDQNNGPFLGPFANLLDPKRHRNPPILCGG